MIRISHAGIAIGLTLLIAGAASCTKPTPAGNTSTSADPLTSPEAATELPLSDAGTAPEEPSNNSSEPPPPPPVLGTPPEDSDTPAATDGPAIKPDVNPVVVMETTLGNMTIELYEDDAPNTVANFLQLAHAGFFERTRFHRVIRGFMIQGGDPNSIDGVARSWGMGGPGYRFEDEVDSDQRFTGAGILAMANSGRRGGFGTNGSQFFITLGATGHLNGKHTIFGTVTAGRDVLSAIGGTPVNRANGPITDVRITGVRITHWRRADYAVRDTRPE